MKKLMTTLKFTFNNPVPKQFRPMHPAIKRRLKVAIPYATAGVAALVGAWFLSAPPDWRLWALFAGLYVVLELSTVEVNDRLFQSSSIMVVMTAGVIFAIEPGSSAMFAMALMAAVSAFVPDDFKEKRWFQPMANFGQLVVSAAAAGLLLDINLGLVGAADRGILPRVAAASILAAVVFVTLNTVMVRRAVKYVYRTTLLQPWSQMNMLVGGQIMMGVLGGLIGAAYLVAGKPPVVLMLSVAVYAIGHMSLYAYSKLRESHRAALRGFIKTLEAKDMYTRGHTERVAFFSQMICEEMRFSGTQQETVMWAALVHDLGKLAVPTEIIRKRGRLTDEEFEIMKKHASVVEVILDKVDFLEPMVKIASAHHSRFDGGGYGGSGHVPGQEPCIEACIISVADAFDAMTSARSYRMAMAQKYAISELESNSGSQFHPEVVEAFVRALGKTRRTWGAPHVTNDQMARRLAEDPRTLRHDWPNNA